MEKMSFNLETCLQWKGSETENIAYKDSTVASPSWETEHFLIYSRNFSLFMAHVRSLPKSYQSITGPCLEQSESSPHPAILFKYISQCYPAIFANFQLIYTV